MKRLFHFSFSNKTVQLGWFGIFDVASGLGLKHYKPGFRAKR